jgi:ankyrin repeat protein
VLHIAAANGHHHVLSLFLTNGSDPYVKNAQGESCLLIAARNGHMDAVSFLVGGPFQGNKLNQDVDNEGKTALHAATESSLFDCMKLLLKHGADINSLDNNKQTPLRIFIPLNVMITIQISQLLEGL